VGISYSSMTTNSHLFDASPTIATGVHASASVALLFFLFEQWECDIYWGILAICRLVYICLILCVLGCTLQKFFFPNRCFPQHWLSTAAHLCPCLSLCLRSGNVGLTGWYLPPAGWCVCVFLSYEFLVFRELCSRSLWRWVWVSMNAFRCRGSAPVVCYTFLSLSVSPSSVLPAFVEVLLFIAVFGLKKKPL